MSQEPESISLEKIRLEESVWPRTGFDHARVQDFAVLFREEGPEALPPIVIVPDGAGQFLVCDGHHRVSALYKVKLTQARAIVADPGDGITPEQFAFETGVETAANSAKPLTRAERNAAVERYLDEHADWADRQIAVACGVSHQTVGRRRARRSNGPASETTTPNYKDGVEVGARGICVAQGLLRALEKFRESGSEGTAAGAATHGERLASVLRGALGDSALDRAREYQDLFGATVEALAPEST